MKASFFMFFNYVATIGVPVLLVFLSLSTLISRAGGIRIALLILIAAGSLVYGVIGIREAFVHGGGKHEAAAR